MVFTLNKPGSLLANKRETIDPMYISHFKRAGAPRRSGMYAKRQDFVRCLLRLRLLVFPEHDNSWNDDSDDNNRESMMMMTPTQMMMTVMVMTPRSRGGCSGLQARASLKLPQTSRQQQFVRFKYFDTIIIIIVILRPADDNNLLGLNILIKSLSHIQIDLN